MVDIIVDDDSLGQYLIINSYKFMKIYLLETDFFFFQLFHINSCYTDIETDLSDMLFWFLVFQVKTHFAEQKWTPYKLERNGLNKMIFTVNKIAISIKIVVECGKNTKSLFPQVTNLT